MTAAICVCKHVDHEAEPAALCPVYLCDCAVFVAQEGPDQTFAVTYSIESCCDRPRPTVDAGEPDENVTVCGNCGSDMSPDLIEELRYARLPGEVVS